MKVGHWTLPHDCEDFLAGVAFLSREGAATGAAVPSGNALPHELRAADLAEGVAKSAEAPPYGTVQAGEPGRQAQQRIAEVQVEEKVNGVLAAWRNGATVRRRAAERVGVVACAAGGELDRTLVEERAHGLA